MSEVKQLSRESIMFIAGETDTLYQHVGLLMILDVAECPDFNFSRFYDHCAERIAAIPQFQRKLHTVPMGLDRPYWVEDEHFSFDHHIKRIALPAPGDRATLCEVAANLYSTHLDRTKPLWEVWLIEGLEGGKYAYLQKSHHCMMDGEGAFKVLEFICDFEAEPSGQKAISESLADAQGGEAPSYPEQSTRALQHLAQLPRDAARGTLDFFRPKILEQLSWPRKQPEEQHPVPSASFNGEVSSERGLTLASLPMDELKAIKNTFGVSLNDVVLALVSGAMRRYLIDQEALPEESLRTNIPVSLRTAGDDQMSNQVTNTTVTLATNLDDPLERLREINRESELAKNKAHAGGKGVVELFQIMPPILVSTVMGSMPSEQAAQMLGANLVVSNVRGSPIPMYIAGATIEGMYPISILIAGLGLNITCVSYCNKMEFGIAVDPELAPRYGELSVGLMAALSEYLTLCKKASRRAKRSPGTRKKGAKSKASRARKK